MSCITGAVGEVYVLYCRDCWRSVCLVLQGPLIGCMSCITGAADRVYICLVLQGPLIGCMSCIAGAIYGVYVLYCQGR